MIRFVTLGPEGSNHQFVTQRYLAFHGIDEKASIGLTLDFHDAARKLLAGEFDFLLQVAVHPSAAEIVARHRNTLFVIDAFVSGSREMAIVCKKAVDRPRVLALQPATRHYVDTSRFEALIDEVSIASVARALLDGRHEAGLTYASLATDHPERFRIDEAIGTVDDAWMVLGRTPVAAGRVIADRQSPAARLYAETLATRAGSTAARGKHP